MPKTKLYIRHNKLNSKGEAIIFIRYSHSDEACDFSTGERIEPQYWDYENRQVRKSYRGFTSLNSYLLKRKNEIEELRLNLQLRGINPSIEAVRNEYRKQFDLTEETPMSNQLLDHWNDFITYQRDIKRVTKETLKQYESTRKKLLEYESYVNSKLTFDKINSDFIEQFVFYLFSISICSSNTVGGKVKHIKAFLNWAFSKGVTTNSKFKEFKKPTSETTIVTLTQQQLDILFYLDLSGEKKLEKARDLFVLGCSTGLRFSDYSRINPANIKGDFIVISTEKTDTQVRIPLNDYSRQILNRYPTGLPKISNVNLNKFIKDVGVRAKFFEDHEVTTYKGGVKQKHYKPLYSLLTTHCARRTFATQSLARGMQMFDTMRVTGHKDVRSFMKYVHVAEPRLQQEVLKAWNTLGPDKSDSTKSE
jgi:site-specific recombinase XerD